MDNREQKLMQKYNYILFYLFNRFAVAQL